MSLELRDLRWAVAASQHRSLRRAAEALNIRQSTLSRRIRDLEGQLDAVLFERTNGGTHPTIEGQEFLEAARRILDETEAVAARLKARTRGESGRLTIGVQTSLSAGNLRATLIEHHRRFPGIRIYLVDGSSDHLVSDIVSSNIDVAFVVESNLRWDGGSLPVWSERVVAALSECHALVDRDVVHWSDLRGESILIPKRGPGAEFIKLLVGKMGCPDACHLQQHDVSFDRLLTLVGAGIGILLALEGATGANYQSVTFREVHVSDGPSRLSFHAIWRQGNGNPSLRHFLDVLRERYPDLSAGPAST